MTGLMSHGPAPRAGCRPPASMQSDWMKRDEQRLAPEFVGRRGFIIKDDLKIAYPIDIFVLGCTSSLVVRIQAQGVVVVIVREVRSYRASVFLSRFTGSSDDGVFLWVLERTFR
jgi:hypothetical protein